MTRQLNARAALAVLLTCLALSPVAARAQRSARRRAAPATPVLWRDPGPIAARNLFHGPGSPRLAPVAPFTFVEEDKGGESPKFDVRDARGVVWRVKLGPEAQAETVSTRLVWAAGYFAEEAYHFERARVRRLPRLSRGREFVSGDTVRGARFEPRRRNLVRGDTWDWDKNPFAGSRELDGLKVIMILLNNYDARGANNRVFHTRGARREARYYVSDIGATLGRAGGLGGRRTKNNLRDFLSTEFVRGVEDDGSVEFDFDTRPTRLGALSIFYPPYYRGEVRKEKSMRKIPVAHARWIGSLLSQLTDEQLRDAFRAAHYDDATADGYVRALRQRIAQLTRL